MDILHYWIQSVHYCLVGIYPYIIVFVSINCCLLSVRVLLVGLCPSIVGYCPSIITRYPYYWAQSIIRYCWVGICPYVIGFVSNNCWLLSIHFYKVPLLLDTVYYPLLLGRYLSVCYWVCVHQLLLTVCKCYWVVYVYICWVGICPYVIGLAFINCCLLSVRVLLVGLCPCIVGYCPSIITRYPSLLDTVCQLLLGRLCLLSIRYYMGILYNWACPLLLGRYLSVCYWVCVHQLLVSVCLCVIG